MIMPVSVRVESEDGSGRTPDLSQQYFEAVRICLEGGSPLDWYRLHFPSPDEVYRFFETNRMDLDDEFDRRRLLHLHEQALGYIDRHYDYRIPRFIAVPDRIEDLLLIASRPGRLRRPQVLACVVLKLMHVINHMEAHSLLHRTAVSEVDLEHDVEQHLSQVCQGMVAEGVPIQAFYGNRKSQDSITTKLLVKRDATAADVLDRVRFRIVTETRDDIVPTMAYLMSRVLPFNHVLERESVNNLVDLDEWLARQPSLRPLVKAMTSPGAIGHRPTRSLNEFSSSTFRIINFVIEMPVRLDLLGGRTDLAFSHRTGRIVYVQAEIQVVDRLTAYNNEQGDNSHGLYKQRQEKAADRRLKWGSLAVGREAIDVALKKDD